MIALVSVLPSTNVEAYRASTDAANLCREIVVASAMEIGDRKYVRVEGWQAIAIAHGCTASARNVERLDGGIRAIGEIRRMADGRVIAEAEGFVGEDEPTWYGGTSRKWKWGQKKGEKIWYDTVLPKRADYAIRAMAQTRAISRAARSAFAHVVVMMNAGLSTTPAEEVPIGGFDDEPIEAAATPQPVPQTEAKQAHKPTVKARSEDLLNKARACTTLEALNEVAVCREAARLKDDLDRFDPELGEEMQAEFERLFNQRFPANGHASADAVFA